MPQLHSLILKSLILLTSFCCLSTTPAFAVNIPFDPENAGTTSITQIESNDSENIITGETATGGIQIFRTIFINTYSFLKYLVIGLAIAVFSYAGIHLVGTAGTEKTEEAISKEKENIKWAFLGLAAFLLIDVFITSFFGLGKEAGTLFHDIQDPTATFVAASSFTREILGVVDFALSLGAVVAVLAIILSSVRILAAGASEEAVTKHSRSAGIVVLGLIVMALAKSIVGNIIFGYINDDTETTEIGTFINAENAASEILGITNYILGFISTIALLMVVYAALRMAASQGNDDETAKAKEILIAAATGLVIAISSYTIVATFINPS